jgi:murein DD-endopeptidase MepM/ murein hydrolase activator NlpD
MRFSLRSALPFSLLVLAATAALATTPAAADTGGAEAPPPDARPQLDSGGAGFRDLTAQRKREAEVRRRTTARRRAAELERRRGAAVERRREARLERRREAARRRAPAPRRTPSPATGNRFPIAGPFVWGGSGSGFGAGRGDRSHQGQDLSAAEGTPVVAPSSGTVEWVRYQASGAGHYVVLDGAGEDRDYVFMHLRSGSIPVRQGQTVRAGQKLGEVGNTGRSFGAHLHFEIWAGGGWYSGGKPIDPLPLLRAWAR